MKFFPIFFVLAAVLTGSFNAYAAKTKPAQSIRAQAAEAEEDGTSSRIAALGGLGLMPAGGATVLNLSGIFSFRPIDAMALNTGLNLLVVSSFTQSLSLLAVPATVSGLVSLGRSGADYFEVGGGMWFFPAVPMGAVADGIGGNAVRTQVYIAPVIGVGYRYWPTKSGLTARAGLDLPIMSGTILPTISGAVGAAF